MSIIPKRLIKKELDDLIDTMRRWVDPYKGGVHRLLRHIEWQKKEIAILEREVHDLRQQAFIKKSDEISQRPPPPPIPIINKPEKWPLNKRLWDLKRRGMVGTEEWAVNLKWNQLDNDLALRMIEEYEVSNSHT
jgi:hypothetical protein